MRRLLLLENLNRYRTQGT